MSFPGPPKNATNRDAALWIVRRLRDANYEAEFAGGCVRDMLMRRRPSDHDVATDARPEQVLKLFRRTRAVGKQFGVVLVGVGDHWIEVATFRMDSAYTDGRHPDSIAYGTIEQDAQRRDFTVNGMFYDPIARRVIDFVGGRRDLAGRMLRAIGDPDQRFGEDHLRLLRAIRFAARLGFSVERDTRDAIVRHAPQLPRVSPERICGELEIMLTAPTRAAAWTLLCDCGLLPHLWKQSQRLAPQSHAIGGLLAELPRVARFELALAVLTLPNPDETEHVCLALRTSNETRETAEWLVRHHRDLDEPERVQPADLKLLMVNPAFPDLLNLLRARLRSRGAPLSVWRQMRQRARNTTPADIAPPPLLNGYDLQSIGVPAGPLYKRILDAVYYAQLNGDLAGKAAARQMAQQLFDARDPAAGTRASRRPARS